MTCKDPIPKPSYKTSQDEGQDISLVKDIWIRTATSECRLELVKNLVREGIGFNEVEDYNISLELKLRSEKMVKARENKDKKIVQEIMRIKLEDATNCHREALKDKNSARKEIVKKSGKNTRKSRSIFKKLRHEAAKVRKELKKKYEEKLKHLKDKYGKIRKEQIEKIPEEIEQFKEAKVFSSKYNDESETEVQPTVTVIGDLKVSDEELAVASLHTKFCVLPNLKIEEYWHDLEMGFAKLRYQLARENSEKLDEDVEEKMKMTEEEEAILEEIEAKSRQFFDPEDRVFDYRKKRVTDIKENSRVTLPKPVGAGDEAKIEIRREIYQQVFDTYLEKIRSKNGTQKANLSKKEKQGLDKLLKRINSGEIVCIKTDKSGKFALVDRETYVKMGEVHTQKDREIGKKLVRKIERRINGHTSMWIKITGAGEYWNHQDRFRESYITHSKSVANLYMQLKDHKKVPAGSLPKTRPVVSGCDSMNVGLSNIASELI